MVRLWVCSIIAWYCFRVTHNLLAFHFSPCHGWQHRFIQKERVHPTSRCWVDISSTRPTKMSRNGGRYRGCAVPWCICQKNPSFLLSTLDWREVHRVPLACWHQKSKQSIESTSVTCHPLPAVLWSAVSSLRHDTFIPNSGSVGRRNEQ